MSLAARVQQPRVEPINIGNEHCTIDPDAINKPPNLVNPEERTEEETAELESGELGEDDDIVPFYNKTSSFFDNISCEANDPQGERITRSAERKLNSETFGIPMNRNFGRGGRGRGGRGGGGYYRGGRGGGRGYNNNYNNHRSNQGTLI